MTWVRVNDEVADDHQADEAGDAALGALLRMEAWASRHLTDRVVPLARVKRLGAAHALKALTAAKLIEPAGQDAIRIVAGFFHVLTAEEVLADRAAAKKRQDDWRKRKAEGRGNTQDGPPRNGVAIAVTNGDHNGDRNAVGDGVGNGPPTRPDPTRPQEEKEYLHAGARVDAAGDLEEGDDSPVLDPGAGWWSIPAKEFGALWEAETRAYMPDAGALADFRRKLEGCLKAAGQPLAPDEVDAFAREACRAVRRIADGWSKGWKPTGCQPRLGTYNLDLVLRVARGEVTDEQLARSGYERKAAGGASGGAGQGGPARGRNSGRLPITRG